MSSTANLSQSRFPVATSFPGHAGKQITLAYGTAGIISGQFIDKNGQMHTVSQIWQSHDDLTVHVSDQSFCQFRPWPAIQGEPPYKNFMSAQSLMVISTGVGVATGIFLYARQVLIECGFRLSPSDNQTSDGKALWCSFDSAINWDPVPSTGGFRPDLTGLTPP